MICKYGEVSNLYIIDTFAYCNQLHSMILYDNTIKQLADFYKRSNHILVNADPIIHKYFSQL